MRLEPACMQRSPDRQVVVRQLRDVDSVPEQRRARPVSPTPARRDQCATTQRASETRAEQRPSSSRWCCLHRSRPAACWRSSETRPRHPTGNNSTRHLQSRSCHLHRLTPDRCRVRRRHFPASSLGMLHSSAKVSAHIHSKAYEPHSTARTSAVRAPDISFSLDHARKAPHQTS